MDQLKLAGEMLPLAWRQAGKACFPPDTEEIRLRVGRTPTYLRGGEEQAICTGTVTEEDLLRILEKATGASMHTAAPTLAQGYVSYRGLRIGVCGIGVEENGKMCGMRSVSSLCIRIARACQGICADAARELLKSGFANTLILGRPGDGKTTALRELIRVLADTGRRISVVDERNELAAIDGAKACFDLGRCSDVLTGVPKEVGILMLLRTMNPEILAMDEITKPRDAEAAIQAYGCGVGILASAHASNSDELWKRPVYRDLLQAHVFSQCLQIRRQGAARTYTLEKLGA